MFVELVHYRLYVARSQAPADMHAERQAGRQASRQVNRQTYILLEHLGWLRRPRTCSQALYNRWDSEVAQRVEQPWQGFLV